MPTDPLLPVWLTVSGSIVVGIALGLAIERRFGSAAKRAARLETDLAAARADLARYQEETKRHFGKSAELLGRMATGYREFVEHFVKGAEDLCGPNMKELNASELERPLLDTTAARPAVAATPPALDADPFAEDVAK